MLATVPPFYDALNAYIGKHIHLLSGPLSFLLRTTTIVDFANRRTWLQRELETAHSWRALWARGDFVSLTMKHSSPWGGFVRWALRVGCGGMRAAPLHHHMHFAGVMSMASGPGVERALMDRIAANLTQSPSSSSGGEVDDDADDGEYYDDDEGGSDDDDAERERRRPSRVPLLRQASEGVSVYHPLALPPRLPRQLEDEYTVLGWLLGYSVLHSSPFPVAGLYKLLNPVYL